jgi:uracil-DNA glycosylase
MALRKPKPQPTSEPKLKLVPPRQGTSSAAALIPMNATLEEVRTASADCRACDLWKKATQTIFGEGKETARVMFVGEIPGDKEDLAGRPFVGPAGQLLDRALEAAGIDRKDAYVTNAVKHFSWEPRGKRRIRKKPRASEIRACRPWLDAEISLVKPKVLVCLGATAAQALLGRNFGVIRNRGKLVKSGIAPHVMATIHPSALLRLPEGADRHAEMQRFVKDLQTISPLLK